MPALTNIFVLLLENRSFDHMLGFSGLTGTDPDTQQPTKINGLSGTEINHYRGQTYRTMPQASETMPVDPGHEFLDVLEELCGANAAAAPGGAYPKIDNSGFVSDYAVSHSSDEGNAPGDYGAILRCFAPEQLPVLNALAKNFLLCDNWHASMPGPTWPNRLFACAASSNGLDHSPSTGEMIILEMIDGLEFKNGSIFDRLKEKSEKPWRIFAGDEFPLVSALKGIDPYFDISRYDDFATEVAKPDYPWLLTWIEPNYGDTFNGTFQGGNSQHPLDGVTPGEKLIKDAYEAIRNSPHWETSLLIVTWDEHGGFYDHVAPPAATPPGDTEPGSKFNQYNFAFDRYGVRVPAVIVSPLIPANRIDHQLYDHSSIPATIEAAFQLQPLTARDAAANTMLPRLTLDVARSDAPKTLPLPAQPGAAPPPRQVPPMESTVDRGNLPGFVHIAMRHDIALSPLEQKRAILRRVQAIQTRAQAKQYMDEVRAKVRAKGR